MSERETCLALLKTHGYLSKNLVSRFLKTTLRQSASVLESLLPLEGFVVLYSVCDGTNVAIVDAEIPGARIYAIGDRLKIKDFYEIENRIKRQFYDCEDIVYPPADSGIYIQEKRKIVYKDQVPQKPPVKASVSIDKTQKAQAETNAFKHLGVNKNPQKQDKLVFGLPAKRMDVSIQEPEKKVKTKEVNKKDLEGNSKKTDLKTEEILGSKMDVDGEASKGVKELASVQKNQMDIDIKLHNNASQISRKNLPDKNEIKIEKPDRKTAENNLSHILSNKSLYTEEEEDEKSKTVAKIKPAPCKTLPSTPLPSAPITIKVKKIKTRTVFSNNRIDTEDYESEEEVTITPPPTCIGKKQGVQQKISFKPLKP